MGLLTQIPKLRKALPPSSGGLLSPEISAFHGSPHRFDRFDIGRMGSGEGAQMHGKGLYFAEKEDTAKAYRDSLTKRDLDYEEWLYGKYKTAERAEDYDRMQVYEDAMRGETPYEILQRYGSDEPAMRKIAKQVVGEIDEYGPDLGHMYEVRIKADRNKFLKLDLPLEDQPDVVRDAYSQFQRSFPATDAELPEDHFYRFVTSAEGADVMRQAGVPGVEYADAYTRHKPAEKQSKNFVVFDDQIIDIARRYGLTIPVATAMMMQSEESQAGFLTSTPNLVRMGFLTAESAKNPKAVKGALTKYDKAMRGNRAFRAREKLRSDIENQTQTLDIGERNLLTVDDLVGKVGVPVTGDTSTTGKVINTVGGVDLESPVQVEGGANFPLRYGDQGYGWASMRGAAEKKQGNFSLAADETAGMEPVGIFSAMGTDAVNFSTPVAEALMQQAQVLPIAKRDIKTFDSELRKLSKDWVGLNHPDALDQLMGRGNYSREGAGALRSNFVAEMSKARNRDAGFPIVGDVHAEVAQQELVGAPIGSSGFSMFSTDPAGSVMPNAPHQSYDTIIPGTYLGGFDQSVPARVMFPKTFAELDQTVASQKSGGTRPLLEQEKLGSLMMNPKLYEPFDEEWAEGVSSYLDKNKGRAAAGAAAGLLSTAAQADSENPSPSAVDYGLGILDAGANLGSALISPIAGAPHSVIQALTSDRPTARLEADSQRMQQRMDYQPRTEIGQQISDEAKRRLGSLLQPVAQAVGDEADKSLIMRGAKSFWDQLHPRTRLVSKSLLDMSPL